MITLTGLSYRTAPIEVRERLAVPDAAVAPILVEAQRRFGGGAALLSTCNRLEFYLTGEHRSEPLLAFVAEQLGEEQPTITRHFRTVRGSDAVRHFYRVACGLDSMVLGETEVLGQIRAAFSVTVRTGTDDAVISRLFHTGLRTGRRARRETAISEHALSVSSIAAQQTRTIFPDLDRACVLVIGAGEAGRLAAQAVVAGGAQEVIVANRTAARAEGLARELGAQAVPFEALPAILARANVVISAVGAPAPVVTLDMLRQAMAHREGAPLLAIDIGVPRDFEPGIRAMPGVTYLDLDDLREVADRNGEARVAEVSAVQAIVDDEAMKFGAWAEKLSVQPTIAALGAHFEQTRLDVVERALRAVRIDDPERERMEEFANAITRHLTKRLLATPIRVLNERGDRSSTVQAARAIFRLDDTLDDADFDELHGEHLILDS